MTTTQRTAEDRSARRRRLGLAGFIGFAGVMHFLTPKFFDDIVPSWMPGKPRTTTYASGVAELACAALVANPRTTRLGARAAFLTFLGVYPANIQMTVDAGRPTTPEEWAVWIRLPLQIPMFRLARRVAKDAAR
jgi:uncharacterized membrane protein